MQSHYRMGLHQRDEEDYEHEDYDEYEEEASEQEEDDEKEEPMPSKEQQEFLKLREKLKEKFRQKLKKESVSAFGHLSRSQDKKRTTTNDKFGSFFGPSQPVIASRVINESRSIRETQHIVSRVPSSSSGNIKVPASTSSEKKTQVRHQQPKAINEVKKKAQTLKDMRDYSFLLSDDADFPAANEEQQQRQQPPAPRNASVSNSDGRSAQASSKTRPPMRKPARPASNGHELKNIASKNLQSQTRVGPVKGAIVSKPRPASAETRKVVGGNATNGSSRPLGPTNGSSRPVGPTNGSSRPVGHKALPSKVPASAMGTNRPPARVMNDQSLGKKASSAVPHSSTQKNHSFEKKRPSERLDKVKTAPNQPLPSSRPQPSKQIPPRDIHEDRLKKKPVKRRFDEEDDEDAIQMIRNMFGYNPNRYAGVDEDDSDMEADFSEIQKEERRSSKIAKKEDEEQLRLIEEEERRERMRKKQKLSRP